MLNEPVFRFHHIGLLVKSIEAATQMQVASFGYQIESDIIHDPFQTAKVRFLRLPQSSHWLELVSPDGEQSKLSNALATRGEGLHHLCYEVEGIESASDQLRGAHKRLSGPTPAVAFGGRRVAWFMNRVGLLTELVEAGEGPLTLASILPAPPPVLPG